MNKYKKVLIELLENAREFQPTQGEKGYYLSSRIIDTTNIKTMRSLVKHAFNTRKGRK